MNDPLSDLAALQGSWEQVAFEADGVSNPPDETGVPGAITTFHRNHFAVHTVEGTLLLEGSFEIDSASSPKTVTWIDAMGPDAGKKLPAIYRLEGNFFVFIAADEGAPKPTEFRTGAGQTMHSFVRRFKAASSSPP
jgi:uncharacterized protein (TIGR03067 family)